MVIKQIAIEKVNSIIYLDNSFCKFILNHFFLSFLNSLPNILILDIGRIHTNGFGFLKKQLLEISYKLQFLLHNFCTTLAYIGLIVDIVALYIYRESSKKFACYLSFKLILKSLKQIITTYQTL